MEKKAHSEEGPVGTECILLNPARCNGCGDCVAACAMKRTGLDNPALSCIQIVSDPHFKDFYLPVICLQCTDPPCMKVCPNDTIYRDSSLNRVMIKGHHCIGCKMCYAVCPIGAMGFDEERGFAFKCDLCGGDPECVRLCEPKALVFIQTRGIEKMRIQESAERIFRAAVSTAFGHS